MNYCYFAFFYYLFIFFKLYACAHLWTAAKKMKVSFPHSVFPSLVSCLLLLLLMTEITEGSINTNSVVNFTLPCTNPFASLLQCCLTDTLCQTLYLPAEGMRLFTTRVSLAASKKSQKVGGTAMSTLMTLVTSLACNGSCPQATTILSLMDPCEPGEFLSPLTLECNELNQRTLFNQNPSSVFFFMIFIIAVGIIFILIITLLYRGRRGTIKAWWLHTKKRKRFFFLRKKAIVKNSIFQFFLFFSCLVSFCLQRTPPHSKKCQQQPIDGLK